MIKIQPITVSSELARCKDIQILSLNSYILLSKKGIVNSETQDNLEVTSAFDDKKQLKTHKQVQWRNISIMNAIESHSNDEIVTLDDHVRSSEVLRNINWFSLQFEYEKRSPIEVEENSTFMNLVFSAGAWVHVAQPSVNYWCPTTLPPLQEDTDKVGADSDHNVVVLAPICNSEYKIERRNRL